MLHLFALLGRFRRIILEQLCNRLFQALIVLVRICSGVQYLGYASSPYQLFSARIVDAEDQSSNVDSGTRCARHPRPAWTHGPCVDLPFVVDRSLVVNVEIAVALALL